MATVVVRCLDTNLNVKQWLCIFLIIWAFNVFSWYIFSYGALASLDEVSHCHLDCWVFSMNYQGYLLPGLCIKTSRICYLLGIKCLSPWGIVVPLCGIFLGVLWFIGMPLMFDASLEFSISVECVIKTLENLGGNRDTNLCNKLLLID